MIIITTSVTVRDVPPAGIFDWIACLTQERYREWDPVAHTGRIRRPVILHEGDTVFFEEIIEGYRVALSWKVERLNRPGTIQMKARIPVPLRLHLSFCPGKRVGDTEVIHQLRIGFDLPVLGGIMDWLAGKTVMRDRKVAAIKRHAVHEFGNLENILRGAGRTPPNTR